MSDAVHLVPIAVAPDEAARMLGMSRASFDRHVRHEVRCIRLGKMRLYPVDALREWADANAESPTLR